MIREVAAAEDALLLDVAEAVPGDDAHFHDSVRFTDAGSGAMARAVSTGLLASPRFRELCGR